MATDRRCHVLGGETFDEEHRKGQASTHITNAKMQPKGDAKDKHSYSHNHSHCHVLGAGETFDEEHIKGQDSTRITNAKIQKQREA